jgi:hypothetical protein
MLQIAIRKSSFIFPGLSGRIAGGIKSAQSPAILAFSTAMRIAGTADLPFLQGQAAFSVTGAALPRAFAVRAPSI